MNNTTIANTTVTSNTTNSTTTGSIDLTKMPDLSEACKVATDIFTKCTDGASAVSNSTYQTNCDTCMSEYNGFLEKCPQEELEKYSNVFALSLTCHKIDDQYCQQEGAFACDTCGKYIAKRIYFSGYAKILSEEDLPKVVECAKSSSVSLKSIGIATLLLFSLL